MDRRTFVKLGAGAILGAVGNHVAGHVTPVDWDVITPSRQLASSIGSYTIGSELDIAPNELFDGLLVEHFAVYLDEFPFMISTKQFIQALIDEDVVEHVGIKDYNRSAHSDHVPEDIEEHTGTPIERVYHLERWDLGNGKTRTALDHLRPLYAMTTRQLIWRFNFDNEANGVAMFKINISQGPFSFSESYGDDEIFLKLADRVLPSEIRTRRNLDYTNLIDREEATLFRSFATNVLTSFVYRELDNRRNG